MLKSKWRGLCLPIKSLEDILRSAGCTTPYIKWRVFLVEAALTIVNKEVATTTLADSRSGTNIILLQLLFRGNMFIICPPDKFMPLHPYHGGQSISSIPGNYSTATLTPVLAYSIEGFSGQQCSLLTSTFPCNKSPQSKKLPLFERHNCLRANRIRMC